MIAYNKLCEVLERYNQQRHNGAEGQRDFGHETAGVIEATIVDELADEAVALRDNTHPIEEQTIVDATEPIPEN
ncbi:MAG: hypothetical protein V1754_01700 [Pseudomonadota bacterium]